MQKGFSTTIVIASILGFLTLVAGWYYLGIQKSQSSPIEKEESVNKAPRIDKGTPSSELKYTGSKGFLKRQFDPNKSFFGTKDYPKEITSISEQELIGMQCTGALTCVSPYDSCFYYLEGDDQSKPPRKLIDQKLLLVIKEANKTIDKEIPKRNIEEVTFCDTEDGMQILRYKTGGGGGGAGSVDYIGLANPDSSVQRIVSIEENLAYFGCNQPLQLTKNYILYYQCIAGDGAGNASSIYKVDLVSKRSDPIIQCSSLLDEATNKKVLTCK